MTKNAVQNVSRTQQAKAEQAEALVSLEQARKQAEARAYIKINKDGAPIVVPCASIMALLLARGVNESKPPVAVLTRLGQKLFPVLGKYNADGEVLYSQTASSTTSASRLVKYFMRPEADASDKISLIMSVSFPSEISMIASYMASLSIPEADYVAVFGEQAGLVKAVVDSQAALWQGITMPVREIAPEQAHRTEQNDSSARESKADSLNNKLRAYGLLPKADAKAAPKADAKAAPKADATIKAKAKAEQAAILASIAEQAVK